MSSYEEQILAYINALTIFDGRERSKLDELAKLCSEKAYIFWRTHVGIKYLNEICHVMAFLKFIKKEDIVELPIPKTPDDLKNEDYVMIKKFEEETHHDVGAINKFIDFYAEQHGVGEYQRLFIHIGLTSNDLNSVAYTIMFRNSLEYLMEKMHDFGGIYLKLYYASININMMSRTHGQPAVPTDLGKELRVHYDAFLNNLFLLEKCITEKRIKCKFGGAVNNLNAHRIICDKYDWTNFMNKFVESFDFTRNKFATQIDTYETVCNAASILCDICDRLLAMRRMLWNYCRDEYFIQCVDKKDSKVIGSSTMPHKINPCGLEKALTFLYQCKNTFSTMKQILSYESQEYQRNIADSSATRLTGEAFGALYVALYSMQSDIAKFVPNTKKIKKDLIEHPVIISEGYQVLLKLLGVKGYDIMKKHTRKTDQSEITLDDLHNALNETFLEINKETKHYEEIKRKLYELTPETYIGICPNEFYD